VRNRFVFILPVLLTVLHPVLSGAADPLIVTAVGDIFMGTTYPAELLPPGDGAELFDPVKRFIRRGDIGFGNLEGPLIDGGTPSKCGKNRGASQQCYEFRMPVRYAGHLRSGGFNVLSIANNHSIDFGIEGLESTIRALESEQIQAAGGIRIGSFRVRDRKVAVAGFSYLQGFPYSYSILDTDRAKQIVRQLKLSHDLVIASFHGGAEGSEALESADGEEVYRGEKRGNTVKFSRAVIDSGAGLVLGHGPHVPRALEVYRGKLIAYSLGNFVGYGAMNTRGPSGLGYILEARLDSETGDFLNGNITSVELYYRGLPQIDPGKKALGLIKRLTEKKREEQRVLIEETGEIRPPDKGPGWMDPKRGLGRN
jgi:poly-gamma-glutamate capsule biosynthesis protein CapA/YwtB (metallophosphatase superfamily)